MGIRAGRAKCRDSNHHSMVNPRVPSRRSAIPAYCWAEVQRRRTAADHASDACSPASCGQLPLNIYGFDWWWCFQEDLT